MRAFGDTRSLWQLPLKECDCRSCGNLTQRDYCERCRGRCNIEEMQGALSIVERGYTLSIVEEGRLGYG